MEEPSAGKGALEKVFEFLDRRESLVVVLMIVGIILVGEGFMFIYVTINHWFNHLPILALTILFSAGALDLLIISLYIRDRGLSLGNRETSETMAPYLKAIDRYFPISNRYVSLISGLAIASFAFIHPILGFGSQKIGDADILLILTGGFLMIYTFIPEKYSMERDFTLSFLVFLMLLMAIVPTLFDIIAGSFEYYFLTLPVHHLLGIFGIKTTIVAENMLKYYYHQYPYTVEIARSCSGIYSFSIFTSAFIAFVLVVYKKIDRKSMLFLILGIFLAYLGNVIRMSIVIASGYYYGPKTLMWVHENIGYIIFLTWMAFFWFILYRFLMKYSE